MHFYFGDLGPAATRCRVANVAMYELSRALGEVRLWSSSTVIIPSEWLAQVQTTTEDTVSNVRKFRCQGLVCLVLVRVAGLEVHRKAGRETGLKKGSTTGSNTKL